MKKIVRVLIFILIFSFVMIGIYRVLSWKDTSGPYLSTTIQLYETEENTIDVLFVGSSHVYCAIVPSILWGKYGMSAFNMAISGQDRESTYYHIKEVLKTQHPKVVCVDISGISEDGYGNISNLYRNMLSMNLSKNNMDLINAAVEKEDRLNFITRWPIIHTRYKELEKYDFELNDFSEFGRGEIIAIGSEPSYILPEVLEYEGIGEIPENKLEWINRIIQLSKDENFELVFFTAPFRTDTVQKGIYNAIGVYLQEQNIPYINYNQAGVLPEINYDTDFLDHAHTNIYGGAKLTNNIGEFLASNYVLDDHKGEPNYDVWELDATYYNHAIQEPMIKNEEDWSAYINHVANLDNMVVVVSLDGDYKNSTLNLYGMLVPFEIDENYRSGGKWIIEDGELIKYIPGDDMEPFIKDLGEHVMKVQNIVVQDKFDEMFDIIEIDNKEVGIIHQGITIMVYDKILHRVIDIRACY